MIRRLLAALVLGVAALGTIGAGVAHAANCANPQQSSANSVVPTQGSPQTAKLNSAFPQALQATVYDSDGCPTTSGISVTFSAPSSGPGGTFQLSGTSTITVGTQNGVANAGTFTADGMAGSYQVNASATVNGTLSTGSFLLTNTAAGVATGITATGGSGQATAVGTQFAAPLNAQVVDANGNPIPNVNVTFAVQPGSGGAGATFAAGGATSTVATNSSGVATSPLLSANQTAGTFTVSASTPGLAGTAGFPLTNTAGTPTGITAGSGSSQATPVDTAFPVPLSVTVTDASKNPVPGVSVTFRAPASGASGTFTGGAATVTVATDSSGVAVAPTFTADATTGGYVVVASAPGVSASAAFSLVNQAPGSSSTGYWLVSSDGGVFSYGRAGYYGSTGGIHLNQPIVGMAATPDGRGYWLVARDGGIFSFGDAAFYGSTGGMRLNQPIVGMAVTPDGRGYWLVAADGGIFSFGDAVFHGSTGTLRLVSPVVGMASSPDGGGYWLVAADGGVFTFGDASFLGSTGNLRLSSPITGMAVTPDGRGYWLVAADGGVFTFGSAAFHGSAATTGDRQVQAVTAGPGGGGYWMVDASGIVYGFGDAAIDGSPAGSGVALAAPIVGIAAP